MSCGSKVRTTPAHTETNCSHGEVEAVCREAIVHKIVNVPQQANRTRLAFELMERFGVNAVGHERRTNAMTRHVAQQDGQNFIAVWEDHAKVTADGTRGTVVAFDRNIVPNQALWCERLLDTRSHREFRLHFPVALFQER